MLQTGIFNAQTGNIAELNKRSFSDTILRLFPNGSAPLFALTGQTGKATADSVTHGYFSKTMEFSTLTINNGAGELAADTTLTVDSTAGIVKGMMFHSTRTRENILVTTVTNATTVEVVRGKGRVAAADLNDDEVLIHIGNAHEQGSGRPTARRLSTIHVPNYTQIFRNAWALTDTARASMAEKGYSNIAESRSECAMFHAVDMESAMIWGQASMDTSGGTPMHTTQGIIDALSQYAPTHVQTAGATTNFSQLEDLLTPSFQYSTDLGNNKERVLFTGAQGNKVLNDIGRKHANAEMTLQQNQMGMLFTSIKTYKGVIHIIEHPLFNGVGSDVGSSALVLDLAAIKLAYMRGRDTKKEEYGVGGSEGGVNGIDAVGGSLTSEFAVEYINPASGVLINGLTAGVA
jgi:hypothetical protein